MKRTNKINNEVKKMKTQKCILCGEILDVLNGEDEVGFCIPCYDDMIGLLRKNFRYEREAGQQIVLMR